MLFEKILVANRGEIAVRVIRACEELGIKTVAVYTDGDREAFFHRRADESVRLEGTDVKDTYLNIEKILKIAEETRCAAIHPGYGFLSENADFVEACESAGLKFIGPGRQTMRKVTDKVEAKKIMESAGVPVLPSSDTELNARKIAFFAKQAGYPLIVKPSFGGGGKGMKIIRSEADIDDAIYLAQAIGRSAFGNAAFYVEKYLEKPRHIEVQILGDSHGKIVHLGERDCSIQRRHQKLIEETPSPVLNNELRKEVTTLAKKAATAIDYENAGTVEFLFGDGRFYFLEVNARIQVEHAITELVTGIDLVKEQIRIAAGEPLGIPKNSLKPRGWAIECRVNAEDPYNQFMPCPGKIQGYRSPGGVGVRVDSGIFMGYTIPPQFDSLLSKLSVWGRDRNEAIWRMRRALNEYVILGIKTTLPLYKAIFREKDFVDGRYDTHYVEDNISYLIELMDQIRRNEKSHDELLASTFRNNSYAPPTTRIPVICQDFHILE